MTKGNPPEAPPAPPARPTEIPNPAALAMSPAIVTVNAWIMAPDGRIYQYLWAESWQLVTDAGIPVERFRSSERWQLHALRDDGEPLIVVPGCEVKAVVFSASPPTDTAQACYRFRRTDVGGGRS